jgi:hypothetical protein
LRSPPLAPQLIAWSFGSVDHPILG